MVKETTIRAKNPLHITDMWVYLRIFRELENI